MSELSVILPFVNEWPQIIWTVRSIAEELIGRVDFKIIAVNNYTDKNIKQPEDKAGSYLSNVSKGHKWLKVIKYDEKLSHWNAKRVAIEHSSSPFLFFCDAHCAISRDALYKAFELYRFSHNALQGTLHLPLTYQILEWHKLIYTLIVDRSIGNVHYRFTGYRESGTPYEVPCMSTCGMLMTRKIYDAMGGIPKELGIYGGGENFINFVLAILGYRKYIMPGGALYHHGDKRGYSWYSADFSRNRILANYMFGGKKWARLLVEGDRHNRKEALGRLYSEILSTCSEQREYLKSKQKLSIEDWLDNWEK